MVISVLAGGLGNQLFQYAFGLRMASQLNTELRLEHRLLESRRLARLRRYTPRTYELDTFGISVPPASTYDVARCLSRVLLPNHRAVLVRETAQNTLLRITPDTVDAICFGYWQSETYFKAVAGQLREQLVFSKPFSDKTMATADRIASVTTSAFLHVRRGDYITNRKANQYHGVCDEIYYQRAVDHLREQTNALHFFVFSDDQVWAKQTLGKRLQAATFVDHNQGKDNWQDMYLMSLCTHAIIANSSFSWWGAWLNPEIDRIVVAPEQWFATSNPSLPPVVPPNWTLL